MYMKIGSKYKYLVLAGSIERTRDVQTQEPSRYSMSLFEGLVPTRLLDVKIPVRLATTNVNMAKKGEVCMESK